MSIPNYFTGRSASNIANFTKPYLDNNIELVILNHFRREE